MSARAYRTARPLKSLLLGIAIVIISVLLFYSQKIVNNLRAESRQILEFYAQFYARVVSEASDAELNFVFEEIIKRTDFPIILTDSEGNPTGWKGIGIDPNDFSPKTLHKVRSLVEAMRDEVDPIPLKYGDVVMNYLYYGDSKSIRQLQWLPFVEIVVVGLFILIGFLGFNSIRRSEQQFIWVGMAKETAHQLGTPISSLMGWIELLKMKKPSAKQLAILNDAEQDIERLNKVAHRFSQIGSKSGIKPSNLDEMVQDVIHYFKRRLPQMGKQVEIVFESEVKEPLLINPELFEWVLENLIKNSLDAIGRKDGKITVRAAPYEGKKYRASIEVTDNGKGIEARERKNIFRPGYSTKKHGWGLGLSLASRIIESYHGGKLTLKESHPGKGTTMRILI